MGLRSRIREVALAVTALGLLFAPAAHATFGLTPGSFSAIPENQNGTVDLQAGSHPYQYTVQFAYKTDEGGHAEGGQPRDIIVDLPPGMVGDPQAAPRCPRVDFEGIVPQCPTDTQIGVMHVNVQGAGETRGPIYNMEAPPGVAGQLAFSGATLNAIENASVRSEEGYGLTVGTFDLPTEILSVREVIWGTPADPAHDGERGEKALGGGPPLASSAQRLPYLTLPTSCQAPPQTTILTDSVLAPGVFDEQSWVNLDGGGNPSSLAGCSRVPFAPEVAVLPTSRSAESATGLSFDMTLPDNGLLEPGGISESQPRKTVVTLPEGVTVNPSMAVGIDVCTPAEYAAEQSDTPPGQGCPQASKIGDVVAHSPLIEEPIEGALYLAAPYDNPFNTLVAGYLIARARDRGVMIKQAGKIELNPATGQITAVFEGLPPLPYSSLEARFREGTRAPLVNPPVCGSYASRVSFTPFSVEGDGEAATRTSSFQVNGGIGGGACPSTGVPPFAPSLTAGTIDNAAGGYSSLYLHIERKDGEQEITGLGVQLPPGLTGNLSGIPPCSEADVQRAREQTGAQAEVAPACPAASEIGHTIAEAGVGAVLVQTPGKLYLGGPFEGAPFSVVAVTSAKVGPFDLGTVVVHLPLRIDPITAQVSIPSGAPDQIPHIIDGVVIHLRAIRVYVSRERFVVNPTSCDPMSLSGTVVGAGANFAVPAAANPVAVANRFQAAGCSGLGFKPAFEASTAARTSRVNGATLTVKLAPPAQGPQHAGQGEEANIHSVKVELPKQLPSRLTTLQKACTAEQFDSNPAGCPSGSRVGTATAHTPILDGPLMGPAYFVSRGNEAFPQLVMVLQGEGITVDLVGDTFISKQGITSSTFKEVPDVPVSSFELVLPQGPYSALAAIGSLCAHPLLMPTEFSGQNGAELKQKTVIKVGGCSKTISISSHKVKNKTVTIKLYVPSAGRVKIDGAGLDSTTRMAKGRETLTIGVNQTKAGELKTKLRVLFIPKKEGNGRAKISDRQTRSLALKFKR